MLSVLATGNRLLDSLPSVERARLATKAEVVHLRIKEPLGDADKRIGGVHFPLGSVVSLLNRVEKTPGIEIATIGCEGLVGLSLSWGATSYNPTELLQVQVPGEAVWMDAEAYLSELERGGAFKSLVQRYTQAFFSQISQQVVCNGTHSIEERCARWLLLTHDRVNSDEFPLTQEFLAQMLGVRRPSVTTVAGVLQRAGFIYYRRGRVKITDRAGLERASCGCYRVLREVFDRLLP